MCECESRARDHYRYQGKRHREESEVWLAEGPGPWSVVGMSQSYNRTPLYRRNAGMSEEVKGQSVGDLEAVWAQGYSTEALGMIGHCGQNRDGRDVVVARRSLEDSQSVQQEADM